MAAQLCGEGDGWNVQRCRPDRSFRGVGCAVAAGWRAYRPCEGGRRCLAARRERGPGHGPGVARAVGGRPELDWLQRPRRRCGKRGGSATPASGGDAGGHPALGAGPGPGPAPPGRPQQRARAPTSGTTQVIGATGAGVQLERSGRGHRAPTGGRGLLLPTLARQRLPTGPHRVGDRGAEELALLATLQVCTTASCSFPSSRRRPALATEPPTASWSPVPVEPEVDVVGREAAGFGRDFRGDLAHGPVAALEHVVLIVEFGEPLDQR